MPTPTLKQLEAFWWAATSASFATAAERLHLSVSSLSKRIHELETALGCALFDRSGQRAALTADGRWLLPEAVRLLEGMAALQAGLVRRSPLAGRCRFGVGELSALTWLADFVAEVTARHPALALEPCVDVGGVLERRLADGELDFAVIAGRSSRSTLVSEPLAQARFVWAAAPAALGGARVLDGALCERLPLVTLPPGAGTTRLLDDWMLGGGGRFARRIECNNWMAIAGMLRRGLGVGFLPAGWIDGTDPDLCALEATPALGALPYTFQWRRGDARAWIPALREAVAACIDFSLPPGGARR
ncbi:MAG: LysR family transcriptional regulator [Candidatus Dactylopiibacterium sp.]|nr:LysR family transcriptional regulator [Candidatus Dactylopiibacterium sp.]